VQGDSEGMKTLYLEIGEGTAGRLQAQLGQLLSWSIGKEGLPAGILNRALAVFQKVTKASQTNADVFWRSWVEDACEKGAKKAHSYTNAANKPWLSPPPASNGSIAPVAIVEEQTQQWAEIWKAESDGAAIEYASAVAKIREHAMKSNDHMGHDEWQGIFNPGSIRKAAGSFNKRTSTGLDQIELNLLAEQPDFVLKELAEVLIQVCSKMELATSVHLNVLSLLGKKQRGFRTIGTLPSYFRLATKILGPVLREWDSRVAPDFDSAAPGKACEYAAYLRQL
jgi:hypothetical protein